MRTRADPLISSADIFLLENWDHNSNLTDDEQRERIFAGYIRLDVEGQQTACAGQQSASRTLSASHGCAPRTSHRHRWRKLFSAIADALECKCGDTDMILNVAEIYDFGRDWQRIFLRAPQLLEVVWSSEEYREWLEEALHYGGDADYDDDHEEEDEDDNDDDDDDDDERARESESGSEYKFDYTPYHWAMFVGRIHIIDSITLQASGGPDAGKVLIVWYDACGRVVRSCREIVYLAADITTVDNAILDDSPWWLNGETGPVYRWRRPLGPPYEIRE
ncbi:hypothetical protein BJY01DRAFT_253592 [Aspergillus pseudoustus]|uniref:Uncharacterized protein n=1 Tax=Aspergillus pseudoustus TaxID=1810923 RepID=A0ABR4J0X9_9EURO